MAYYMLQKLPDGESAWADSEGETYNFARRLPNAKNLCKNDRVVFYRPTRADTADAGCFFAIATVARVEVGDRGKVDAILTDYVLLPSPVPIREAGNPRRNNQHSLQAVTRKFFENILHLGGPE
jgi:hypothetical protein